MIRKSAIVVSAFWGLLTFSAPGWSKELLTIATGDYEPWAGKNLKNGGFVNHLVKVVFEDAGYDVRFVYVPWARNHEESKKGKYDASSYWKCTDERRELFICSEQVAQETYVFFHLKTYDFQWNTLDDLKGLEVGATRSYAYTEEFLSKGEEGLYNIQFSHNDTINFRKLVRDRINVFPISLISGYSLIQREFDPAVEGMLTFNPKPLLKLSGHLLFPKANENSERLAKDFNESLRKLVDSGVYDQYYNMLLSGGYRK